MRAAVFFERDGVLNRVEVKGNQQRAPATFAEFQLNSAAREPLRQLKAAGYALLAITNQPGLSDGSLSRRELEAMHALLEAHFALNGVLLCPHGEADDCPCRKPKSGLLIEAAFKWHLDLERSFIVSDKWQDAQAAHVAGCTSILLRSPWNGTGHHDFIVPDLATAVHKILLLQPSGIIRPTFEAT